MVFRKTSYNPPSPGGRELEGGNPLPLSEIASSLSLLAMTQGNIIAPFLLSLRAQRGNLLKHSSPLKEEAR